MKILNKIVVSLLLLVTMILVPLILIVPDQAESWLRSAADIIRANMLWLDGQAAGAQVGIRLLLALAGLFAFLVCLLLLVLEIFPLRRKTVSLQDNSGELMIDSINSHLSYHLDLLPDVLRVRPKIASRGKAVRATIYIETPPDVNVPQKTTEVQEITRQVLEDQLGLQTKDIKVVVRPVDYPKLSTSERKRPMRADRPIAPPLTPVEPMVEDKEAAPLLPQQEEHPYGDETSWPPAQPEYLEPIPPSIEEQTPAELPVFKADAPDLPEEALEGDQDEDAPAAGEPAASDTTDDAPLEPFG
jgi:hypothetical protein